MKIVACPVAVLTLALLAGSDLRAQYRPGYPPGGYSPYGGGPYGRPAFSPYLNIIGRGNPAVNYYGITRPQQDFRNAMYGAGGGAGPGYSNEDPTDPELRRGTGHVATFNNLSHYYYNHPAMGGMGGAAGFGRLGGGVGAMGVGQSAGFGMGGAGFNTGFPGAGGGRRGFSGSLGGFGIPRR